MTQTPQSAPGSTILLNGAEHALEHQCTVSGLLADLGLGGQRVAVEINRSIVPRAEHGDQLLTPGDVVEIVHFVGGG